MNNIVLIGFMGSGKTTIARALSQKLDMDVLDMDTEIEKLEGRSIREIFDTDGQAYFRDMETKVLKDLQNEEQKIISTGGGVILKEENRELLHNIGTVVFLQADANHIYNNVKHNTSRPLLQVEDPMLRIKEMLEERDPIYLKSADVICQTSGKTVEHIVDELVSIL